MKAVIKPREAPARERSCTAPEAEEASWVERGLARARRSLPEAVMVSLLMKIAIRTDWIDARALFALCSTRWFTAKQR